LIYRNLIVRFSNYFICSSFLIRAYPVLYLQVATHINLGLKNQHRLLQKKKEIIMLYYLIFYIIILKTIISFNFIYQFLYWFILSFYVMYILLSFLWAESWEVHDHRAEETPVHGRAAEERDLQQRRASAAGPAEEERSRCPSAPSWTSSWGPRCPWSSWTSEVNHWKKKERPSIKISYNISKDDVLASIKNVYVWRQGTQYFKRKKYKINKINVIPSDTSSHALTVYFSGGIIGVFWDRESRPIKWHNVCLLTQRFTFPSAL
jgi:Ca2+/Na+ antiporter